MSTFQSLLVQRKVNEGGRHWVFVSYDQLTDRIGPLNSSKPAELGIVMVESIPWFRRRPYHRQKIGFLLANMRQFALEQASRGVAVKYVSLSESTYAHLLEGLVPSLGPLKFMEPAERELRVELRPLVEAGKLEMVPHDGWLTDRNDFDECFREAAVWRMESFYRHIRKQTGLLMDRGKPTGGKYSFDSENRRPWRGEPVAPTPSVFLVNDIKREVAREILARFSDHPGELRLDTLPTTEADADTLWTWARDRCLPQFGPFEDAMARASRGLFHTRISALLNVQRLPARRVLLDAIHSDIGLSSKEGFIRQLMGWREYVRHVHNGTDGFRSAPDDLTPIEDIPGDGGYGRWRGKPWPTPFVPAGIDGGASPSLLGGNKPVPPALWGQRSGMACLDEVVASVWEDGYSHHITRLMIICNVVTLLGVSPRELTDWFWCAYTDAYDWVVEPNVLGMGTYAVGNRMMTKPYVSGAAYVNRMSDFCRECRFDPKADCPITPLYWAFLARNESRLAGNPRMHIPLASLRKRSCELRRQDQKVFERASTALFEGLRIDPKQPP